MADGVAPDKLYPLDVDRAFRKLEAIKPHISVWWTSGGQSALLIQGGEVDMEMIWNGRVSAVMEAGADADYTYNQGILQNTSLCILKNAPNLATAVKFVNEAIDPKLQANLPLNIPYGPGNPAAFDTGIIRPRWRPSCRVPRRTPGSRRCSRPSGGPRTRVTRRSSAGRSSCRGSEGGTLPLVTLPLRRQDYPEKEKRREIPSPAGGERAPATLSSTELAEAEPERG